MRFGVHVSIAGSIAKAFERAADLGCGTMQIFSRNPRGWKFSDLTNENIEAWKTAREGQDIEPVTIHMPYLPNLASDDPDVSKRSTDSLTAELQRAELLECRYICTHIGKGMALWLDDAITCVASAIDRAIEESETSDPIILLENTAGQGTEIGNTMEEIGRIVAAIEHKDRIGVCIDTCHAHAAGYDLSSSEGLERLLTELDQHVGMERLKLVHLNDAKREAGSHVDRHEHIGLGTIGDDGMRRILNHPKLVDLPVIMETPVNDDRNDKGNLAKAKSLLS